MELENTYYFGKHSINLFLSTSYIGIGFTISNGDFIIYSQINLLVFHLTLFIDKGRRSYG